LFVRKKTTAVLLIAASFLLPVSSSPPGLAVWVASPAAGQASPPVEAYALADAPLLAELAVAQQVRSGWVLAVCLAASQAVQPLDGYSAAQAPYAPELPQDDLPRDAEPVAPPDDWVEPEPDVLLLALADSLQEPDGHLRPVLPDDLPVLV
jgi:hypothetical protein